MFLKGRKQLEKYNFEGIKKLYKKNKDNKKMEQVIDKNFKEL